jgi:protease YdgD
MRSFPAFLVAVMVVLIYPAAHAETLVPVPPISARSPASAVARLNNGTAQHCTAVLLSDAKAATAAHCLYNRKTKRWIAPGAIHLLFGYDRGSYTFHTVTTHYRTGRYKPDQPLEAAAEDWAILELAAAPPEQFARIKEIQEPSPHREFRVIGFASPKQYVLSEVTECVAKERGGLIGSQCPIAAGMSGAPLIDMETGALIGIQIGGLKSGDEIVLIGVPVSAWQ